MAIPGFQAIMLPLLRLLGDGQPQPTKEIRGAPRTKASPRSVKSLQGLRWDYP